MEVLKGPRSTLLIFEGGEREPWDKHSRQPVEAGKGKETDSSLEPLERHTTHHTLILA